MLWRRTGCVPTRSMSTRRSRCSSTRGKDRAADRTSPSGRSRSTSLACPARSPVPPSIPPSMSSTRSWLGPATAGRSPGPSGDGQQAVVRAPEVIRTRPPQATEPPRREQTRARYPDKTGFVERDGVRVFYEVYGSGEPTILLLPTWSIVHSRIWKMQIPDLARRYRVVTFDPRGNGRSDRPASADGYAETEYAADAQAVMDATATQRAILVSLSMGAQ